MIRSKIIPVVYGLGAGLAFSRAGELSLLNCLLFFASMTILAHAYDYARDAGRTLARSNRRIAELQTRICELESPLRVQPMRKATGTDDARPMSGELLRDVQERRRRKIANKVVNLPSRKMHGLLLAAGLSLFAASAHADDVRPPAYVWVTTAAISSPPSVDLPQGGAIDGVIGPASIFFPAPAFEILNAAEHGSITYDVSVPVVGRWWLWARCRHHNDGLGFWVRATSGLTQTDWTWLLCDTEADEWQWISAPLALGILDAGMTQLEVAPATRSANPPELDLIVLTDERTAKPDDDLAHAVIHPQQASAE